MSDINHSSTCHDTFLGAFCMGLPHSHVSQQSGLPHSHVSQQSSIHMARHISRGTAGEACELLLLLCMYVMHIHTHTNTNTNTHAHTHTHTHTFPGSLHGNVADTYSNLRRVEDGIAAYRLVYMCIFIYIYVYV